MKNTHSATNSKKKYRTPRLSKVGSVTELTLKTGSQSDAFGGSYAP